MIFVVFDTRAGRQEEFVTFWAKQYFYKNDDLYTQNIGKSLSYETIQKLFLWKNGGPLSGLKKKSVQENFASRLSELTKLPRDCGAESFLNLFATGGAIWRIFFLHIWQPNKYPIYDQHVHRSMCFLKNGRMEEIGQNADGIIESYIRSYLPFYAEFPTMPVRSVDKALWMFGRFLKSPFRSLVSISDDAELEKKG